MTLITMVPSLILLIPVIIVIIKNRKTERPEKIARIFAVIALIGGLLCFFFSTNPFEYKGPGGIDYIGQALVWAFFFNLSIMTSLGIAFISAIAATIFSVKAMKKKEKRASGIISLIMSWILGVVIIGIILTNVISEQVHMRSIKVRVTDVTQTVDSDGEPAIIATIEFENGTRREICYMGSVYDEVTQGGKHLGHSIIPEIKEYNDSDLKMVAPGTTAIIKKGYKIKNASDPVNFYFSSYGGDVIYGDYSIPVPNK